MRRQLLSRHFELSNDVYYMVSTSITDLMVRPGLINLDFADVESVMRAQWAKL